MQIPLYQVDAFARRQFGGNPGAVCPLAAWLPDATLQAIASENNLAETAFFVKEDKGAYRLRWFTPAVEVDLCGHATLAAAYVLWEYLRYRGEAVTFASRSGPLTVTRTATRITLDFPVVPARRASPPPTLIEGLGVQPLEVWSGMDFMVVLPSEEDVRTVQPAWEPQAQAGGRGVIVTAPGWGKVDFVSRFFAPAAGINEDPVTGSAHCMLTPYWAQRLGKKSMHARQLSARGGELWVKLKGDRVLISGQAQPYLKGTITLAK
ncbi:MAG: PhzF family phenazine biosynthesis protein [Acidobacteria bacterium]|nr:PhzF family phenazine biosynthesis protein [Acidobacteriota bacterium]